MKLACPEVRIETTTRCNANCTICCREKLTRKPETMDYILYLNIIAQLPELGVTHVGLYGFGEPLLDNHLERRIRDAINFKTIITTNASLLKKQRRTSLIESGLSVIRFSVHALTPLNYGQIHRGLRFPHVLQNILGFLDTNEYFNHPVETHMSVIPMHNESIEEIRAMWEGMVDYLEIWKPHNWVNKKEYRVNTPHRKTTCGRPFRGPIQINADGTVMVCCFDYNGEMTVGDLNKSSLQSIIKSDAFELIREKHKVGDLSSLPCETCDQLNISDSSPLIWSNTGDDNSTSITKFKLED